MRDAQKTAECTFLFIFHSDIISICYKLFSKAKYNVP